MKLIARSLDDTQLIAKEIASFIIQNQKFLVFYLEGNLGTGKTTLVRKILQNSSNILAFEIFPSKCPLSYIAFLTSLEILKFNLSIFFSVSYTHLTLPTNREV